MNTSRFAVLVVCAADGITVHGPFKVRGDAILAADWFATADTITRPIALHPPETDPITTRTTEMTGEVIELPTTIADLFTEADEDPVGDREVVVSLLFDSPARRLALWVGPFADTPAARAWCDAASNAARSSDYQATVRIHRLRRTDRIPTARATGDPTYPTATTAYVG